MLPDLAASLANAAREAFVDGMHAGVLVAAGATLIGAVVAAVWLPARANDQDVADQEAASDAREAATAGSAALTTGAEVS